MLVRFYKYDFWIPEQILGWSSKTYFEKIYFFAMKKFSKDKRRNIFRDQKFSEKKSMKTSMKNEKFEISKIFRENRNFEIFIFH